MRNNMIFIFFIIFSGNTAYLLYFHGIVIISVIISICLSVCTARKIAHYQKDIAHQLRDSESRRYNENKQWYVSNIFASMRDITYLIDKIYMPKNQ